MIIQVEDRHRIEILLRKSVFLNLYTIGDLDDFYWKKSTAYGLIDAQDQLIAVVLLYKGFDPPILLALADDSDVSTYAQLLAEIAPSLPPKIYLHLSPRLIPSISKTFKLNSQGMHFKMGLISPNVEGITKSPLVQKVTWSELHQLTNFYNTSYPDNSFDPRMIDTNQMYCIKDKDQIICAGGVHVLSTRYRVAALGNIATHPGFRSLGYGKRLVAHLCYKLMQHVDHIGLNVKANNQNAISLYQKLGFELINDYIEFKAAKIEN